MAAPTDSFLLSQYQHRRASQRRLNTPIKARQVASQVSIPHPAFRNDVIQPRSDEPAWRLPETPTTLLRAGFFSGISMTVI
jgi:hypothetical protein